MNQAALRNRALSAVAFVALAGLAWHHMAILGDGFWTIATGRWLLEHRALPQNDPFSFGSTGEWMVVSSGACVLFAEIVNHFGLRSLMLVATLIEAFAAWLVWARAARSELARLALLPLVIFYVLVDAEDLSARGQVFGDLALLGILARVRDRRRIHPAFVFLLSVVWTNLHLSFLAVVVLPLFAAAVAALEPATRERTRDYLIVATVAAVGTCVNPYGPAYLSIAAGTAFDSSTTSLDLFRSPDFHSFGWLVSPAIAIGLLIAISRSAGPFKTAHATFLLFFLAAACKFTSIRDRPHRG